MGVHAQPAGKAIGAAYLQACGYSNEQFDVFSVSANQAVLSKFKQFQAGIYHEKQFLVPDLSNTAIQVVLPSEKGNFGFDFNRSGAAGLASSVAGIAYGKKLHDKMSMGVQLQYHWLKVNGYGSVGAAIAAVGALFQFTEKVHGGIHLYNPLQAGSFKSQDLYLPAVYSLGLGYDVSELFFVTATLQKTKGEAVQLIAALHYNVAKNIFFRGGITTGNSSFYMGSAFQLHKFRIDATASFHPYLGVTPGLVFIVQPSAIK